MSGTLMSGTLMSGSVTAGALFSWLLLLWAKASALLIFALLADRLLHRAPARTRHALWTATFATVLALPVLSALLPALPVPGLAALLPTAASPSDGATNMGASSNGSAGGPSSQGGVVPLESGPEGAAPFMTGAGADGVAAAGRDAPAYGTGSVGEGKNDQGMTRHLRVVSAPAAVGRFLLSAGNALATRIDRLVAAASVGVIGLWALGAAAALLLLAVSMRRARRLARRAGDLRDEGWRADLCRARAVVGLRDTVRLRASTTIDTPMAGGLWRRVVLLPERARRWNAERRRFVLLHELVHLARHDPARHLVARLALALHWPNPLAWAAAHCAMSAREQSCDDQVLALGARPSEYARELLALNELLRSPHPARIAALPMIQPSLMEKRVMNILRTGRRPLRRSVTIGLVTVAAAATLSVAAAAPQKPQEPEPVKVEVKVAPVVEPRVQVEVAPAVEPKVQVKVEPAVEAKVHVEVAPDVRVATRIEPAPEVAVAVAPEVAVRIPAPRRLVRTVFGPVQEGSACVGAVHGNFSGSMSMRSDDGDGDYTVLEQMGVHDGDHVFMRKYGDTLLCMRTEGEAELDEETGEVTLGAGGRVIWETQDGRTTRRLEVAPGDSYTWSIDGQERPFDADAQSWYDGMREVVGLQWQIAHIRGQVASKRGEIASIRGAIASLRARRSRADEAGRTEIDAGIKEHEARIAQMEQNLKEYDVDSKVAAVERALEDEDIDGQVAAIEQRIEGYDLDARLADLEREIEGLHVEGQVERIQAEIDAMNADERVEQLREQLEPALARLQRLLEQGR